MLPQSLWEWHPCLPALELSSQALYPAAFSVFAGVWEGFSRIIRLQIGALPLDWIPASSEPPVAHVKVPCIRASPSLKHPEAKFRHRALLALCMVEISTLALLFMFSPLASASSHFPGFFFVITLDGMGKVKSLWLQTLPVMSRDAQRGGARRWRREDYAASTRGRTVGWTTQS